MKFRKRPVDVSVAHRLGSFLLCESESYEYVM